MPPSLYLFTLSCCLFLPLHPFVHEKKSIAIGSFCLVGSITLGDVMPLKGIVFVVVVTFHLFYVSHIHICLDKGNTLPSLCHLELNELFALGKNVSAQSN